MQRRLCRVKRGCSRLLPSLQTINIFSLLLPTFLSWVLVADFPPDLLQNPFFKLVRVIKHMGGPGQEGRKKERGSESKLGWRGRTVRERLRDWGCRCRLWCVRVCVCVCQRERRRWMCMVREDVLHAWVCSGTLDRGSLLGKFTPSLTRSFFSSSLRTSSCEECWEICCAWKPDGQNIPVKATLWAVYLKKAVHEVHNILFNVVQKGARLLSEWHRSPRKYLTCIYYTEK